MILQCHCCSSMLVKLMTRTTHSTPSCQVTRTSRSQVSTAILACEEVALAVAQGVAHVEEMDARTGLEVLRAAAHKFRVGTGAAQTQETRTA